MTGGHTARSISRAGVPVTGARKRVAEDNERLSDTNPAEKLRPGDPDPSAPRDAEADGSLAAPGRPTRRSPTWRTAPRGYILSKKSGKNSEMRQIEANRGRHS